MGCSEGACPRGADVWADYRVAKKDVISLQRKSLFYEFLAEMFGTGLHAFFGIGANLAIKLTGVDIGWYQICVIAGMGVAFSIYMSGGVSNAHVNPSVTVAVWLFRGFPGYKIPAYVIAQTCGTFLASAIAYIIYLPLLLDYEDEHGLVRGTAASLEIAGLFSTYPHAKVSIGTALLTEFAITVILVVMVFALTDDDNGASKGALGALMIGLVVTFIGCAAGPLTAFSMNAARDLGPKIFTSMAGWGTMAFTGNRSFPYFLVPLIAPALGGVVGGAYYQVIIFRGLRAVQAAREAEEQFKMQNEEDNAMGVCIVPSNLVADRNVICKDSSHPFCQESPILKTQSSYGTAATPQSK